MSTWTSRLARSCLAAAGWKIVYQAPPVAKAVIVFYPHTSNWDFVIGVLTRAAVRLPARYAAKDSLFTWPLGSIFRRLGGIPVNRRQRTGFVAQLTREFAQRDQFYLVITPEGTRRLTPGWKSGFYRIALAAGVPLGLAFIDYDRREVGISAYLDLSGDEARDLETIRRHYAGRTGRHPAQQAPIVLLAAENRTKA